MPDLIMYQQDCFVVLETEQPEQFLTPEELLEKLTQILKLGQIDVPRELEKFEAVDEQALYLRDNFCELDVGVGQYLQWYVVRLEK